MVRQMGFPIETADAITHLEERWDGKGHPAGLRGDAIPLAARIASLSQTLEVFAARRGLDAARDAVLNRSGRWFDPSLAAIVERWSGADPIWQAIGQPDAVEAVVARAPDIGEIYPDEPRLDAICEAFADVIDAKSPFTARHSAGVAVATVGIARAMDLDATARVQLRRAALLHDIGKLAVPNAILEKPDALTADEWATMRSHPRYTLQILQRAPVLREFAAMAAAHHEKLDGTGYHLGLGAEDLSLPARVLAVADIYDALTADRPYRKGLSTRHALDIIAKEVPAKLDADCYEALRESCRRFASSDSVS